MHLKTKLILILIIIFPVFASLNYGIHHFIILPGFKSLETREAKKDIDRCIRAIKKETEQIDTLCHDWSAWDDLYEFMISPSTDFIRKNLNMETMLNSRLNLVCITGIQGKTVFCEKWNLAKKQKTVLAVLPKHLLSRIKDLTAQFQDRGDLSGVRISGIYNHGKEVMMLSVRPVVTSDNQGPIRGMLVLGRSLDQAFVEELKKQVEVDFSIMPMADKDLTSQESKIPVRLMSETIQLVEQPRTKSLTGYYLLPDIGGEQGFLIRARLPRYILEKGRATFSYSLVMISVLGLFMAFLVVLLVKKIIVAPITAVTDYALEVAKSGDLSCRIHLPQADEIGILGREMNRMVEQMEIQTRALARANQALRVDIEKRKSAEKKLRESEKRFQVLHEASFGGIAIHDQGSILDVNQALSTITGYDPRELIGMDGFKLIAPPWREAVQSKIKTGYEHPYDLEGLRKDGSVFPLEIQGKSIPFHGKMVRVTEFRDISSRKKIEEQLTHALEELKSIIENSQVGIMVLKGGRIFHKGNQRLADILGYETPEAMVGLSMEELHLSEDSFSRFGEKYFNRLVHGEQIQVEYQLKRRDKTPVWCTLSGKAIDPSLPPDLSKGVIWVLDDITEKMKYQEKLKKMAATDFLTGLCNRRHFMKLGGIELKRQMRYPHCGLSLIMLDIDHFKKINDLHGHDMGDLILQHFTRIGQKCLRDVDIFARIGGEEFVILLPSTDLEGSMATAERFRQAVETSPFDSSKGLIPLTVSLGVSHWAKDIKEIGTLLKHADQALYAAKQNGRNRVECHTRIEPL
jgi:diguanylate cyclase (GGDEF)-like protein/PAS domain S-box-containing protein